MSTKVINSRVVGGLGCGWAKLNVLQKRWFLCQLAALLILRSVGILSVRFSTIFNGLHCRHSITGNGLQLQEVGSFEALNCLPPLNLIRSTKLHLTTEPPISCRSCYLLAFCPPCSYMPCQY